MSQDYAPFSDLIAALRQWSRERRTGIVYVATDTNHSAQINLEHGEIIFLVFKSKLGASALSLMQTINACRFRFAEGAVAAQSRVPLPATSEILDQLASNAWRSDSGGGPGRVASAAQGISGEAKTILERALAEYIGPMVAIVCPEHFERARDLQSAIDALACEIPRPEQALRFKEDVSRKLRL
jgi:hypothetical protein